MMYVRTDTCYGIIQTRSYGRVRRTIITTFESPVLCVYFTSEVKTGSRGTVERGGDRASEDVIIFGLPPVCGLIE